MPTSLRNSRRSGMSRGAKIHRSLKPGVFRPGLLEDRDVGIGVFPEGEEILVGSLRFGLISRESERPAELQVRQWAYGIRAHDTTMIENLLELGRRFRISVRRNQSLAAHIRRVQTAK